MNSTRVIRPALAHFFLSMISSEKSATFRNHAPGEGQIMAFPIEAVRRQFPALAVSDKGRRRIYLDNPAGTQVAKIVADAVAKCLIETNANLGGFFETTVAAGEVV